MKAEIILWDYYTKKDGTHPIKVKVTTDRTQYHHTGYFVQKKFWNEKSSTVKKSHPESEKINDEIKKFLLSFSQAPTKTSDSDFLSISTQLIERYKNSESVNTYQNYAATLKNFKRFSGLTSYQFTEVTELVIYAYHNALIKEGYNDSTRVKMFTQLGYLWEQSRLILGSQIPSGNPFRAVKITPTEKIVTPLSLEELESIRKLELSSPLELARDVYFMSFNNAGMRISDLATLTSSSYSNEGGKHVIRYVMRKTGRLVSWELSDEALQIVEKYRNSSKYLFPLLKQGDLRQIEVQIKQATVEMNRMLKKIAELAGIKKKLTNHTARHTYASVALVRSVDPRMIQSLLGHSSLASTEKYLGRIGNSEMQKMNLQILGQ